MAMTAAGGGVFSPEVGFPLFPLGELTDDEVGIANRLAMRLAEQRPYFDLRWNYYDGLQKMQDLGISIPPSLNRIRTTVGWAQIGVDALVHRCVVEGFRFPDATDVDDDLMGIWQANNLDGEAPLAHLEALVSGRAYIIVGAADESSLTGEPLITVESPRNMAVMWDARLRRVIAALQIYYDQNFASDQYGHEVAAFYTPGKTVIMARSPGTSIGMANWEITSLDQHNIGFVPIVRMSNRQRLTNRDGDSEITAAWMNTIDSATRTLLGMDISRELHAAPRRYVLGAMEEMFQRPDGSPVTKWEAYLDQLWMVERDENGELPTVGEFKASDPSTYTKLIDTYTEIMAMHMGLPAAMLGKTTQGNPASADAIRVSYEEITGRARAKHVTFSEAWEQAMRYALLIRDGKVDPNASRIETDWRDPAPRTVMGDSAAITQQIAAGAVPATSDVTLKHLGYSSVERKRLEQDRKVDPGEQFLAEVADSLVAKDVSIDARLLKAEDAPTDPAANVPSKAAALPVGAGGHR